MKDKERAVQLVSALIRARKNFPMYPANHPMQEKTIDEFCQILFSLLDWGNIKLRINQYDILFQDETVYHNRTRDESLALFFFRDGLRELSFSKGVTREEIINFLQIISMDYEREVIDDDIVTLLWERDFQHISYVVDDTFLLEGEDYEKVATENARGVAGGGTAVMKAYKKAINLKTTAGMDILPLTNDNIQSIVQEVENDPPDKTDMLITMLSEMLHMAEENYEYEIVEKSMKQTLDYAISKGNLSSVNRVLEGMQNISQDTSNGDRVRHYAASIEEYVNSEAFVKLFGEAIDGGREIPEQLLQEFASLLRTTSIPQFVSIIGELKRISSRRIVIRILSKTGAKDIELLAKGLKDERWYVVRNIIYILRKIANESATEYISRMTDHPDKRVKKEALHALGELGTEAVLPVLKEHLNDRDESVRIAACIAVGLIGTPKAKQIIVDHIKSRSFRDKNFGEKKEIFTVLCQWKEKDVIGFLIRITKKWTLFKRAKNNETRAAAIHCLGQTGAENVLQLIEGFTQSGSMGFINKVRQS